MAIKLINGNSLEELKTLEDNSVDSIVTDPPYEIGFMGKKWDNTGIAYNQELWSECLRVLKPGGHLLAFGATRSYHRMTVAIEDSGFEIRDCIMWLYGSGFPKSHNIGKAIDKINGTTKYEGWGTALKPAVEPVVMARKPFKGTVADNVLEHETGAINIDECRINYKNDADKNSFSINNYNNSKSTFETYKDIDINKTEYKTSPPNNNGRWPANVILDEEAGAILDEQSGISKPSKGRTGKKGGNKGALPNFAGSSADYTGTWPTDNGGGASRFFYCPKANRVDRNEGCGDLNDIPTNSAKMYDVDGTGQQYNPQKRDGKGNNHPTVKPTDLLAYLIRLVTPKGGVVLDPFMGSGSCGKAAVREGMSYIGIELEREYYEIAQARIKHEQDKHKNPFDKFTGNPDEENI